MSDVGGRDDTTPDLPRLLRQSLAWVECRAVVQRSALTICGDCEACRLMAAADAALAAVPAPTDTPRTIDLHDWWRCDCGKWHRNPPRSAPGHRPESWVRTDDIRAALDGPR